MDGISGISSPALSALTKAQPQTMASEVGTAMLGKSLDLMQTMGDSVTKMMEQSVNPGVGGRFDMSV
ncbi:MAG: YjfB family protein [Lachnospiraceae bacterium]|nr:YjfB family protein [Lachnospiraceae bacterium]